MKKVSVVYLIVQQSDTFILVDGEGNIANKQAYDPCCSFVETCVAGLTTKRNPVQTEVQRRFRRDGRRRSPVRRSLHTTSLYQRRPRLRWK